MAKSRKIPIIGLVVSTVLVVLTLLAVFLVPEVVQQQLRLRLPLSNPLQPVFPVWQDTDAENVVVERSFYLFNLTNPFEVYWNHSIPDFVPIGPFVFREHTYSPLDTLNWRYNAQLHFNYFTDLTFMPEKSVDVRTGAQLSLNTTVVTPNFPLFTSMWRLGGLLDSLVKFSGLVTATENLVCNPVNAAVGDNVIGPTGIFINRTADELFFGYEDPLWEIMAEHAALLQYKIPTTFRAVFNHSQPAPSPWSFRFGQECPMWNDQSICNSSGSNVNRVLTGDTWTLASQTDVNGELVTGPDVKHGSYEHLGEYLTWAGQDSMWWWGDDNDGECQRLEGTNGLLYPPGLTKESRPYVFYDALFRKIRLQFHKESESLGLPTYQFTLDQEAQLAGPQTKCYTQMYDNLMNITLAMFGPAFISNPFYHKFNTSQLNLEVEDRQIAVVNLTFEGLSVEDWMQQHSDQDFDTRLDIEPLTGTLMEAHARIQFTTWMRPIHLPNCSNMFPALQPRDVYQNGQLIVNSSFPHTLVPFFYLDRHCSSPQSLANKVYAAVILPLSVSKYLGWTLFGLSLLAGAFCIGRLLLGSRASEESEEYTALESGPKAVNGYTG